MRRYKRFLADMILDTGEKLTAHCPNTGGMTGCADAGSRCWLSESDNPRRKYRMTWEFVQVGGREGPLVGINTHQANKLVAEGIESNLIRPFRGAQIIRREPPNPLGRGRFDFAIKMPTGEPWLLEVKNVTAAAKAGRAVFPDAKTIRGTRHMNALAELARQGFNTAVCFCVQREDVEVVAPADEIDPAYGIALREAAESGVKVLAAGCRVSPAEFSINRTVAVDLAAPPKM